MIASAEVVRRIIAAPAPVLLPDTCALLDLMRDPTREAFSSDQVAAAQRLLLRAEARPRTLWVPISAQVLIERGDQQKNVKRDAAVQIRNLEERIHRVQSIMAAHGLNTTAIAPTLVASNFPDTANSMVDRYFSAGQHVRNQRGIERRAYARIAANRAPSQKGQQAKDCIVIESYLHLASQLRDQRFEGTIVFLTTNRRDYSDPANFATVHQDLVAEFGAVNMTYAVNFQMAEYQLA
jgi:hypothetical protein